MQSFLLFLSFYFLFLLSPVLIPVYATPGPVNISENYAFGYLKSFAQGITFLVNPAFNIAGVLVVFWFLWGAFDIVSSGGQKEKLAAARNRIIHAIIGFILLIFVFLVLQFLPVFFGLKGFKIIE